MIFRSKNTAINHRESRTAITNTYNESFYRKISKIGSFTFVYKW